MAKIKFRDVKFSTSFTTLKASKGETMSAADKVAHMVEVVEEYASQDMRLTARQLYYQFVSRAWIPNTVKSYKSFTALLADARYAGLIDWDAIEDRGREPSTPSDFSGLTALADAAVNSYRLPRWEGQDHYVELWVEKQALAGVLEPLAHEYHATLMVNKGYSSASAMFESSRRFRRCGASKSKTIFYLGDHDPSGEDMVRDIKVRLVEFGIQDIRVVKLALTMQQIEQYNPPPNPAKMSDSRAAAYVERHGDESWEVDALPPNVLQDLIREAFDEVIDRPLMDEIMEREETDKTRFLVAVRRL